MFRLKRTNSHPRLCPVSVPSSSGHVFRRPKVPYKHDTARSFSPLFIGACVSTRPTRSEAAWTGPGFSPLFIGACVSTCRLFSWRRCSLSSFSPLFIGACVSTIHITTLLNPLIRFSPLFIGACVSTSAMIKQPTATPAVSVPSSSGHVFRRSKDRWS